MTSTLGTLSNIIPLSVFRSNKITDIHGIDYILNINHIIKVYENRDGNTTIVMSDDIGIKEEEEWYPIETKEELSDVKTTIMSTACQFYKW